ncbi:transposase [Mesorhizobium sp. J428]|uniref:integrase core domain-containing protein n=1 Tax=Mesorhizobium sp. J428 TaxID=2898440 RepID=UPI0035B3B0CB
MDCPPKTEAPSEGVEFDFSRPGKPTDNAFIESFNGKFQAECLNAHRFLSLDDARAKMEEWCQDYIVRPHSDIGNKPPISLMKGSWRPSRPQPHHPEVPTRSDPNTQSSSHRERIAIHLVSMHSLKIDPVAEGAFLHKWLGPMRSCPSTSG